MRTAPARADQLPSSMSAAIPDASRSGVPGIAGDRFLPAMGVDTIGGYVISSPSNENRSAARAEAIAILSWTPPKLRVSPGDAASLLVVVARMRRFCVNLLDVAHADPVALCEAAGDLDRFEPAGWRDGAFGIPDLDKARASMFCEPAAPVGVDVNRANCPCRFPFRAACRDPALRNLR